MNTSHDSNATGEPPVPELVPTGAPSQNSDTTPPGTGTVLPGAIRALPGALEGIPVLLYAGTPKAGGEDDASTRMAMEPDGTDWSPLHPNHLAMERRTSWILFWILLGIMIPVNGVLFWLLGRTWVLFGCVMGTWIVAGGLLWLIQVYLPRSHDAAGWMLSPRGMEIRKGVWWQHVIVIPKSRIQHTDLQQGPVLRAYGLANLSIYTAGTENAEIELEGLSLETAQHVRDRLMEASRQPPQEV